MNILLKVYLFVVQIVGAIKSLESLGDVVSTSLKTVKKWQLTEVRTYRYLFSEFLVACLNCSGF